MELGERYGEQGEEDCHRSTLSQEEWAHGGGIARPGGGGLRTLRQLGGLRWTRHNLVIDLEALREGPPPEFSGKGLRAFRSASERADRARYQKVGHGERGGAIAYE